MSGEPFSERGAGSFDFLSSAKNFASNFGQNVDNRVQMGIAGGNARMYVNSVDPYTNSLNAKVRAKAEGGDPTTSADPSGFYGSSTPEPVVYYDAPFAEKYGMDASTAYQEALANTAYQRKVADLKAAGLNPVLGYSGSGAASFYGTPADGSGGISAGSAGSAKTSSGFDWVNALPYLIDVGLTIASFTNPVTGSLKAGQIAGQTVMKGFGPSLSGKLGYKIGQAIKSGLR